MVYISHGVAPLIGYLCGYMAKKQEQARVVDMKTGEVKQTGRCWGIWGDVPLKTLGVFEVDPEAWDTFHAFLRKFNNSSFLASLPRGQSAWVWLDGEEFVRAALCDLPGVRVKWLHDEVLDD